MGVGASIKFLRNSGKIALQNIGVNCIPFFEPQKVVDIETKKPRKTFIDLDERLFS